MHDQNKDPRVAAESVAFCILGICSVHFDREHLEKKTQIAQ